MEAGIYLMYLKKLLSETWTRETYIILWEIWKLSPGMSKNASNGFVDPAKVSGQNVKCVN